MSCLLHCSTCPGTNSYALYYSIHRQWAVLLRREVKLHKRFKELKELPTCLFPQNWND